MPSTFPLPWSLQEHEESLSIVDANGFSICWLYYGSDERAPHLHERLTKKQAYVIGRNICRWAKEEGERRK